MRTRGYTLLEALIAGVLLIILLVPLGYVVIQTGAGRKRAEVAQQALQIGREAWGVAAVIPIDSLTDTSWDVQSKGRRFRIVRDVWDSSDGLRAEPVLGATRGAVGAARPASVFEAMDAAASPRKSADPVEVSICVADLSAAAREGMGAWARSAASDSTDVGIDTVFCWRYLRSRQLVR